MLHKFKAVNEKNLQHALDLIDGKIYLCDLNKLNDPHEINFSFPMEEFSKFKICSLVSGSNSNYMMWIHYANSFNGVAVEYKIKDIKLEIDNLKKKNLDINLHEIQYIVNKPTENEGIINCITKKYFQWHYENEFRIVMKGENLPNFINIRPNKIMIGTQLKINDKEIFDKLVFACNQNDIKYSTVHPNMCIYMQETVFSDYIEQFNKIKSDK